MDRTTGSISLLRKLQPASKKTAGHLVKAGAGMRKKGYGKVVTPLLLAIVLLAGCSMKPATAGKTATSGTTIPAIVQTTASPALAYRLVNGFGRFLLIPESLAMLEQSLKAGIAPTWLISDQMQWEPAACSTRKVLTVTGRNPGETTDSSMDIFQVTIGSWTACCLRRGDLAQDDPEKRILQEIITNELFFTPQSKDYSILRIFDDLYAVDRQGQGRMISQRQVGGFDYDTVEKKGKADLFAWAWTHEWVCSPLDNRIFYLTAREGLFYSIWSIDLDQQTESRFGQDVAFRLPGVGNRQLIAYLTQRIDRDPFGKLINIADAASFTALADKAWESRDGWLYRRDGRQLTLRYPDCQVMLDCEKVYQPLMLGADILWFCYMARSWQFMEFLQIDLKNRTCAAASLKGDTTLAGYQRLLADLAASRMSFAQAEQAGIKIMTGN